MAEPSVILARLKALQATPYRELCPGAGATYRHLPYKHELISDAMNREFPDWMEICGDQPVNWIEYNEEDPDKPSN